MSAPLSNAPLAEVRIVCIMLVILLNELFWDPEATNVHPLFYCLLSFVRVIVVKEAGDVVLFAL